MFQSRRRFLHGCAGGAAFAVSRAGAADNWLKRPPEQWEPADALAVLTHSAWTRTVYPELSPAWLHAHGRDRKGMSDAEGARDKRQLTEFAVLVRWESGLPIRLARKNGAPPDPVPAAYQLSLSRIPLAFIASLTDGTKPRATDYYRGEIAREMERSSTLEREGKAPLPAVRAGWTESDFEQRIVISFSHEHLAIEPADQSVTLTAPAGPLILRAQFPLSRMVFRGRLEL